MSIDKTKINEQLEKFIILGTDPELQKLELVHFSKKKLANIKLESRPVGSDIKPVGLWLSVENETMGWSEWLLNNQPAWFETRYTHANPIKFTEDAKIIWLKTSNHIDIFSEVLKKELHPLLNTILCLHWNLLDADAILISPYQWERRLGGIHRIWYYGWDCASGCVFNPDKIMFRSKNEWKRAKLSTS
jgi:hypothetical protein